MRYQFPVYNSQFPIGRMGLLILAVCLLYGCGGGASSLTGGSIPIGLSRVAGVVTRADNSAQTVPDSPVTLVKQNASGLRITGPNGAFDFDGIAAGTYTCVIHPPTGSSLAYGWDWDFDLADRDVIRVVARLWPSTFDLHSVGTVNLNQSDMTLHVGDTVRLLPTAADKNSVAISLAPSIMLDGDIGTVAADGTFTATKVGAGKVVAWMGIYSTPANITVLP